MKLAETLLSADYSKTVTFLLGPDKTPVKAHRAILAACSDAFHAMFYSSGMREATIPVTVLLPDVSSEIMGAFIHCCYFAAVPSEFAWKKALDVLKLADRYCVFMLQSEFRRYFAGKVTTENCAEILAEAPVPYGNAVAECAYETLIGTEAIEKPGVLNRFKKEAAMKILGNVMEGLNPNITMSRLIEYAIHHSIQSDSDIKATAAKILTSCSMSEITRYNIMRLARGGIVDTETLLEQLLDTIPEKIGVRPTRCNPEKGIVMCISSNSSDEVATRQGTFGSIAPCEILGHKGCESEAVLRRLRQLAEEQVLSEAQNVPHVGEGHRRGREAGGRVPHS